MLRLVQGNALFAADGTYLGWVDDGPSPAQERDLLCGRVVEQNYIVKKPMRLNRWPGIPRTPPMPPIPPSPARPGLRVRWIATAATLSTSFERPKH